MRKYLLVVFMALLVGGTVSSQSTVFNSGDICRDYNGAATLGTPGKPDPNAVPDGEIAKWVRTRNSGRIGWSNTDEAKFKPYFVKGSGAQGSNNTPFRLRYPKNYDSTQKYPVILFFHGAGEKSGDNYYYENEDQLFWGAEDFYKWIDQNKFNAFLLFPQEETNTWNPGYLNAMKNVIDTLAKYKGADLDRVISMGLSSGGEGSINFMDAFPSRVATTIASSPVNITGGTEISPYLQIPVWFGNGGFDTNPDREGSNAYYNAIKNAGGIIYQSYYPRQDHVMWTSQWNQVDKDNNLIIIDWWNRSHKANPVVYYDNKIFCEGSPIAAKMGLTAGFFAYEWQKSADGNTYVTIPGATSNEYTATEAGTYRARFMRNSDGTWSVYSPNPVVITTKPCSVDTVFKEDFEYDKDYLTFGTATPYKKYSWNCQNGILTTSADNHMVDATGILGRRFNFNYTYSSGCNYTTTDNVWGMYNNQVAVKQNTKYLFSFYVGNQTTSSLAQLTPRVNGVDLIAGSVSPSGDGQNGFTTWRKYSFVWNSGNASSADMAIKNKNATSNDNNGNDFTLDEISLTRLLAPGGVYGSAMWVKAGNVQGSDNGTFNSWANAAGGLQLLQNTLSARPIFKNNIIDNINFNPVANFDNSREMNLQGGGSLTGSVNHTRGHIFIVGRLNNISQAETMIEDRQNGTNNVSVSLQAPTGGDTKGKITWRVGATSLQVANVTEANVPALYSFSKDDIANTASGFKQDIRKNGVVIGSNNTTGLFNVPSATFTLGDYFGRMGEAIYYLDSNITPLRQSTIESYLAVKYGLSLGTPASPVSYRASDSSTIFWAANATYQNDVFGIGTDSTSGLRQIRSNSANTDSISGVIGRKGKGNLVLATNANLLDKSFLMIGNDATSLQEQVTLIQPGEGPAVALGAKRISREWKVDNTGNVGSVNLSFDTSGITYTGGNVLGNFKIMVDLDGDGNFGTGSQIFYNASASGVSSKIINFNNITLADNAVFTMIVKAPAGALPATWLDFTAEAINGNGVLNWKTADEFNVAYYAVEHSTTGANFKEIGKVAGKNSTGVNSYNYTDASLSAGTHYYRIRRVDVDGKFGYSVVKIIKVSAVNAIQIRPNPVTGNNLVLGISLQQSNKTTIQVVSVDGKVLARKNIELVVGVNTVSVDISNVPTGIYLVQVQLNDEVASKKFIKVR